jgi:hypothetical protein
MLETIILGGGETDIDIAGLKESAKSIAPKAKDDKDFDRIEADLLKKHSSKPKETKEKPAEVEDNKEKEPAGAKAEEHK